MKFGEKAQEYSAKHGKDLEVWQSPKYKESKAKAEEIINSGKYNVQESDFWILMNVTKNDKMAYTGLIISHNGCLKINDCLESKFDPSCVTIDKDGYKSSLVYSYCNIEQGIYEVGEVNNTNCKNEYPYAMALKRLFDRVVLKLSKLAYAGIYSDSEADEFAERFDSAAEQKPEQPKTPPQDDNYIYRCENCGEVVKGYITENGTVIGVRRHANGSKKKYNKVLCLPCIEKMNAEAEVAADENTD